MQNSDDLLVVEDAECSFGGVKAVRGCSLKVRRGSSTALIGPNGAGKTTLVNLVGGALRLHAGRILFDGKDISAQPRYLRARAGLIRTFQISRELGRLTVYENLMVAAQSRASESLWAALARPRFAVEEEEQNSARASELLRQFGLYPMANAYAAELSGGQKRLLEMARALMAQPKLLLLDEPMAGINPALAEEILGHVHHLVEEGITVLMVEHNLRMVEQACDHVIVMAEGRTLAEGTLAQLRENAEVVDAYLGAVRV